ncbi:MAG: nicotinate-nicotinamide nucleotide adenylyltransferase [Patescibacteria group bacterium]|nr:nicotinate-nicotinamide nucleotide adenylyltransferase [Patescibacteria group bacterium]MDE2116930.1 nicotinate-nicotinamide nucleotide adenylyltransferase [Patescibacteria group bacterium]
MKKKTIALFGGAFNPPHVGHSAVVRALDALDFIDEIWLMPSANRWDKAIGVSGPDRLRMIDLMIDDMHLDAAKPVRGFDHEVRKPNLSTTYETKTELEKLYPYHEFHFVFGSDVVPNIAATWVNGKEFFEAANFIFIERPGHPKLDRASLPPHSIAISLPDDIVRRADVSSTIVRAAASDRTAIGRHVSPSVAEFIEVNRFYSASLAIKRERAVK